MFVGAKHDRIQYGIITNNLSAVMLRPLLKNQMHPEFLTAESAENAERKRKERCLEMIYNTIIPLFFAPLYPLYFLRLI
jgi:hypothetical protein